MANDLRKLNPGEAGALAELAGAEIDMQVQTAKRYPRVRTAALAELLDLSTASDEIAEACLYSLERKEKGGGFKYIIGPSIRFAEILVYTWGNVRWGARIIDEGKEFVTALGFCHDLERNTAAAIEVKRRITTSEGHRYGTDMIGVTSAAACSIAQRNAVFDTIPEAVWRPTWERSREKAVGNLQQLRSRVDAAISFFVKAGASEKMIYPALGVKDRGELTLDHVAMMIGLRNAVKDNLIAIDRLFHPEAQEERVMLGLTAAPTIDQRQALAGAIKAGGAKAGGGGLKEPAAGPSPDASAGAADKTKGKGKGAKADTAKPAEAQPAEGQPAADPGPSGDPMQDPAAEADIDVVKRITAEMAAVRGPGRSQPIRDNQGALRLISELSLDPEAKAGAAQLLGLYDLEAIDKEGGQS